MNEDEKKLETQGEQGGEQNPAPAQETPPADKTFTQAELNEIIKQRLERQKKEFETKQKEAQKLAQMNAEEKAKYEAEQKDARIKELEAELNARDMFTTATQMLVEKGIKPNADLISPLIKETAEETKKAVENFVTLFQTAVAEATKEALKGKAPKAQEPAKPMTKEDILKIKDAKERIQAIQENQNLF